MERFFQGQTLPCVHLRFYACAFKQFFRKLRPRFRIAEYRRNADEFRLLHTGGKRDRKRVVNVVADIRIDNDFLHN